MKFDLCLWIISFILCLAFVIAGSIIQYLDEGWNLIAIILFTLSAANYTITILASKHVHKRLG